MRTEFAIAAEQLRAIADAIESADEGDGAATLNPRTSDAGYVMTVRPLRKGAGFPSACTVGIAPPQATCR